MDDSPRMVTNRRPNRLSLKKRPKTAESPKTPCRITISPNTFSTPPSIRFTTAAAGGGAHSTPLTHNRRTYFNEESPSQDYDSDPQTLFCSQDTRHHMIDVDWKWEEQCPNIVKKMVNNKPRRIEAIKNSKPQRLPPKKVLLRKSPECDRKRGFFKFKEELLKDLNSDSTSVDRDVSPLTDFDVDDLESSFKENDDGRITNPLKVIEKIQTKIPSKRTSTVVEAKITEVPKIPTDRLLDARSNSVQCVFQERVTARTDNNSKSNIPASTKHVTNQPNTLPPKPSTSTETNLLEDSDLDVLLLQCSQKVEANYHDQVKRIKIEKNDQFGNDSLDDFFLSVPSDDKLIENVQTKSCRSPLIRHHSMPAKSPSANKVVPVRTINNLNRHNSMPINDQKQNEEKTSSSGSKSSSSESLNSDKRRCTAAEIERKRIEAIQRRDAKLKKSSIFSSNNKNNVLNANKVKR